MFSMWFVSSHNFFLRLKVVLSAIRLDRIEVYVQNFEVRKIPLNIEKSIIFHLSFSSRNSPVSYVLSVDTRSYLFVPLCHKRLNMYKLNTLNFEILCRSWKRAWHGDVGARLCCKLYVTVTTVNAGGQAEEYRCWWCFDATRQLTTTKLVSTRAPFAIFSCNMVT